MRRPLQRVPFRETFGHVSASPVLDEGWESDVRKPTERSVSNFGIINASPPRRDADGRNGIGEVPGREVFYAKFLH